MPHHLESSIALEIADKLKSPAINKSVEPYSCTRPARKPPPTPNHDAARNGAPASILANAPA